VDSICVPSAIRYLTRSGRKLFRRLRRPILYLRTKFQRNLSIRGWVIGDSTNFPNPLFWGRYYTTWFSELGGHKCTAFWGRSLAIIDAFSKCFGFHTCCFCLNQSASRRKWRLNLWRLPLNNQEKSGQRFDTIYQLRLIQTSHIVLAERWATRRSDRLVVGCHKSTAAKQKDFDINLAAYLCSIDLLALQLFCFNFLLLFRNSELT